MQSGILVGSVVAFLFGVAWRTLYEVSLVEVVWVLVMAFAVGLVWRRKSTVSIESTVSAPYLLLGSLCLFFISLGIIRTEVASWQFDGSPLETSLGSTVSLTGVITSEPDYREQTVHLHVQTEEDLVLVTTDRLRKFSYGDKVAVSGKIKRPESFVTDLGRTFNYPGYLKAKGIEYSVSFAEVKVIESGLGNPFISLLLSVKQEFIESLQSVIPEPDVGLGMGLLLGVKSALGEDIEQDFRRTGIIHIVVLSGYNVMLVVAFIMFCFSFFLPFRPRVIVGVVAIASFALIVGLSATVVRASVMACLVLLSQVLGKRYNVMRALLLAGTLMIIINPYLLIYDIGFQLSFMATMGLILLVPHFEATVMSDRRVLDLKGFFLATVATQVAVLPLLMYHIGEVSLIAVLVNVLVLPAVPFAMLLTFLTGVIGLVSVPLAGLMGFVATLSLSYILLVAKWAASIPLASVVVPQFSALMVFLLYGLMIAAWYYFKNRHQEADSLSGWVIEEEEETAGESLNSSSDDSPAVSDTPIFFR